jgi:putative FmdB family regulatory protein
MPIYEFYCPRCHVIFSFLSRKVNTRKRPDCPRCGRPRLERKASTFAVSRGRPEPAPEGGPPDLDEARLERAMEALAGEAESLDENDPRQMAGFLRRFHGSTGLPLSSGVEEAIRRLEAGESLEKIEEEMGDLLDDDADGGAGEGVRRHRSLVRRLRPPAEDPRLYEL